MKITTKEGVELRTVSSLSAHAETDSSEGIIPAFTCMFDFTQEAVTGTANYILSGPTLDNNFPQIT